MIPAADPLRAAAFHVRENARAAFSHFHVGAALEDSTGRIHTGCNIENASYSLTVCAERVAVFKALSEGAHTFTRIAVAAAGHKLAPPCGPCRQILWEFCGNLEVILVNPHGDSQTFRLAELLPHPFDQNIFL